MPKLGRPKKYDFAVLRADFLASNISLAELSRQRSVPANYLHKMAAMGRWHELRAQQQAEAHCEAAAMVMDAAQSRVASMERPNDVTPEMQLDRSKMTGNKLYVLFQAAVGALESGDLRQMRQAIDAWVVLDDHMRKVHGLDVDREKPLVNIQVMAALPDKVEAKVVELELVPA